MKWLVTGRKTNGPRDAIIGKAAPIPLHDDANCILTIWGNGRGIWARIGPGDANSPAKWVEIAINPAAPPRER